MTSHLPGFKKLRQIKYDLMQSLKISTSGHLTDKVHYKHGSYYKDGEIHSDVRLQFYQS